MLTISFLRITGRVECGIVKMMYVKRYMNPNPGRKPSEPTVMELSSKPKKERKKPSRKNANTYARIKKGVQTGTYSSDG